MAKRRLPKPSLLTNLPAKSRYVSRGGEKLRGALDAFGVPVEGRLCMDIGSSTGGFTDCLLQSGARGVIAIDVGWGLLDYKLRKDPRVQVVERTNVRHLAPSTLTQKPSLITIDVSFISLDKILPKAAELLAESGDVVALVKPQFEAEPREAPGGIVKDDAVRHRVMDTVLRLAESLGFRVAGRCDSAVSGRKGNREMFLHLHRSEKP